MARLEEYKDAVSGITSGYALNDGINPKVPYSFNGTIYDEDEKQLLLSVLEQDALTMGPQVAAFQKEFAIDPQVLDRDEVMGDIYYKQQCTQGILHYQPTYDLTGVKKYLEARGYGGQFCPHADEFFYRREFNLPMHPRLTREDLDTMIEGLRLAAKRCRKG